MKSTKMFVPFIETQNIYLTSNNASNQLYQKIKRSITSSNSIKQVLLLL